MVILGVIFAITRPTVYQAETTLIVSNNMSSVSLDSSDISLSQRLVITYSEIAKNKSILNKVINKYDLKETYQLLLKNGVKLRVSLSGYRLLKERLGL